MAKSSAGPEKDEAGPEGKESGREKSTGGIAGLVQKLPVAAIGSFFSGLWGRIRSSMSGDGPLAALVKNIRDTSRGRLFAIIGLIVILLLILVILIASLAASITASEIRSQPVINNRPAPSQGTVLPGSDAAQSGQNQSSAVTEAARIPWLEKPILPNEHDFFLKGEWGVDREPRSNWSLDDVLVHWQDLAKIYVRQLREHNSDEFKRMLEEDR